MMYVEYSLKLWESQFYSLNTKCFRRKGQSYGMVSLSVVQDTSGVLVVFSLRVGFWWMLFSLSLEFWTRCPLKLSRKRIEKWRRRKGRQEERERKQILGKVAQWKIVMGRDVILFFYWRYWKDIWGGQHVSSSPSHASLIVGGPKIENTLYLPWQFKQLSN